jgi:hypothetical protein
LAGLLCYEHTTKQQHKVVTKILDSTHTDFVKADSNLNSSVQSEPVMNNLQAKVELLEDKLEQVVPG